MRGMPFVLLLTLVWAPTARGQDDVPFTRLFDTGVPAAEPLIGETLAKAAGWKQIPEDITNHNFSGDALLLNDKLAVVLRKQGRGPEIYSRTTGGLTHRAELGYIATRSSPPASLDSLQIIENTSGAVKVEATSKGSGRAALRFRLTTGEAILEIQSSEGGGFLDVRSTTRYVVVPDYFGDDMVYSATTSRELSLPAENFCLSLIEGNDAMLMAVWQSNEQDVWLAPTTRDKEVNPARMQIHCLKDKTIWLSFLEGNGLWRALGGPADTSWRPPFPAKWRCSFTRENGLADSWDTERGPGPGQSEGKHEGPLIVYPIDRTTATPITATCPTDVMRNTLGVGPCQYILSCEGLGAQGDPTPNSVMGWVEKLVEQKKEKNAADDIRERLDLMSKHIVDARSRIQRYAEFPAQVRSSLEGKGGQFQIILDDLDRIAAAGLTPASSPDRARQLAGKVTAIVGKNESLTECQQLGQQLRSIGAVQDAALAKCRMGVRRLSAEARSVADTQSPNAILARQVQRLADQMLRIK